MQNLSIEKSLQKKILICRRNYVEPSLILNKFKEIEAELISHNIKQLTALSLSDALDYLTFDLDIQCILIDWNIDNDDKHKEITKLLDSVRSFNKDIPIFIVVEHGSATQLYRSVLKSAQGFFVLLEDTTTFIAGRIAKTITIYRQNVLPPMFSALVKYADGYEYSWHTPGHTGGVAFMKSPVGQVFFDFFGEQIFRSDLSASVSTLGSLLAHSGSIGEGERHAAKVFGADRTYYVTGGTSASNRMVVSAILINNELALCDRNCHKSIEHSMTLSGAVPVYLIPTRNHYGMIGPISAKSLSKENIRSLVQQHDLLTDMSGELPRYAVITNSTYDGLCYNTSRVINLLDATVNWLHFDEAWYSYARFHPLYENRHAMSGNLADYDRKGPTIFATQSTHKLLAAFSQTSMIHVRDGRAPIEHKRFNEAYAIHSTTSPFYPMIAANDVSAAMMDTPQGQHLVGDFIKEAVKFRQMIKRISTEYQTEDDWFFSVFQPDQIIDAEGKTLSFHEADPDYLASTPSCWLLNPSDSWHGFSNLEDDYCLLDPTKVHITTPGVNIDAGLAEKGIPAYVLSQYLINRKIVASKIADFSILILFSLGITKSKWGTLINVLLDFKTDYDDNKPLLEVLPALAQQNTERYAGMGLKDLCDEMFAVMKELDITALTSASFSFLPQADMTPAEAYKKLVKGMVELVPLSQLAGRTVATAILPHPPAIPVLMPGENTGPEESNIMRYLYAMQTFDNKFPGFEHDIQGLELINSEYQFQCIA